METLKVIDHPIAKTAAIIVEACAYAGTGNVLKIQSLLHYCDEHIDAAGKEKEKEGDKSEKKENEEEDKKPHKPDDTFQAFAVLGVAMIAMGEEIGAEMSLRQLNHLVCALQPKKRIH